MSESSFVIITALTVFFVGLLSWVYLFTGFGLGYAVGFAVAACAMGAVGSAFISMYLLKSAHRSKVVLHGQGSSS